MGKMKAVIFENYGSPEVLQLKEAEKPKPKKKEVLIRVHAASVTATDTEIRINNSFLGRIILGIWKPRRMVRIPGIELSGEIELVGKNVRKFKIGDKVYACTMLRFGAYAEYICLPEKSAMTFKPNKLNYEEAATVGDSGTTALFFLKTLGRIKKGDNILIIGASGGVGTYAVQLANHFEAEVDGVCSSTNIDLVKSLGAQKVFDYTKEDFKKSGKLYDIIFDTVGKSSFSDCKSVLKRNGRYLDTTTKVIKNYLFTLWTLILSKLPFSNGKRYIFGASTETLNGLIFLRKLIEDKKVKPIVDRIYPIEKIVEAHEYVERGHKKGGVAITIT